MITILAPYFSPAVEAGGPIKSIGGVCKILDGHLEYQVITRDRDIDGTLLDTKKFQQKVDYLSDVSTSYLRKKLRGSNLIWFNSLLSVPFSIKPLLALFSIKKTTVLLSPRGQLLYGAINPKKKLFLNGFNSLLKLSGHNIVVHYTHISEKEKSYQIFKNYESVIFANPLSGDIKPIEITINENNNFIIGFFGRLTPKKNVGFLLNLLPNLDASVTLEIHGAIEDKTYKAKLDEMIIELNIGSRVTFCGQYSPENYPEKAKGVDVIAVPSLSENFCHVFFEAIEMRKLVIGSDGLPWEDANNLVEGTILPLEENMWSDRIRDIMKLSTETYHLQQEKQIEYYNFVKNKVEQQTLHHFTKLAK